MKTIVMDDAVSFGSAMFQHLGNVITLPGREIDAAAVKNADALIVRSRTQVNEALLDGSSVKFVGSTVVGLDHVDQLYLQKKGIWFYSAQGCNANSVSEYVFAALFHLAETQGFDLVQKSIGIIGVGQVGSRIAAKAGALGMNVLLNDPPRAELEPHVTFNSLEETLSADIVTFHTPLTSTGAYPTHHLLNTKTAHFLKGNVILINAARGGVIDETVWTTLPTQANIIDCWENEPRIDPMLYEKATIATPHIAGHALDAKINGTIMVYEHLCQFWEIPQQDDWKRDLPPSPASIPWPQKPTLQSNLFDIFKTCYDPVSDDNAIRSSNIDTLYKKFEYYRRHYPEHREWPQHRIFTSGNTDYDNLMKTLGFQVISELN